MQIFFVASMLLLAIRIFELKMWKTFPAFAVYLMATIFVTIIPNPKNEGYWQIMWEATASAIMILRIIAIAELFWISTLECLRAERLMLFAALACASATALLVAFINLPETALGAFVLSRQCMQLAMFFWLVIGGAYLLKRDIVLERNTAWHFILFIWLLTVKVLCAGLDLETGLFTKTWHFADQQEALNYAMIGQSVCYLVWAWAFQEPKRHWWFAVSQNSTT